MTMLMSGWIMEPRELPSWPPSRDGFQTDERLMAAFAACLDLDEKGWNRLVTEALQFTTSVEFEFLWSAITGLSERAPVLDRKALGIAEYLAESIDRIKSVMRPDSGSVVELRRDGRARHGAATGGAEGCATLKAVRFEF
jgi:hypothetical protein